MSTQVKNSIARLRSEARHFRDLAAGKQREIQEMQKRPVVLSERVAMMEAGLRRIDYKRSADECDRKIAELRAQQ
ncbi:hypothetical protein GCM10027093_08550 [Paraburkholderia jirisanensis]